jgi:hypothetical protein
VSRKLRIEYPGAMYHVMNRGDQREDIFRDDQDRQKFLSTLGEACGKTEWQVHAYCLIRAMSLKWIAARLQMGTWTYVSNLLNEPPEIQPQGQEVLPLCQ